MRQPQTPCPRLKKKIKAHIGNFSAAEAFEGARDIIIVSGTIFFEKMFLKAGNLAKAINVNGLNDNEIRKLITTLDLKQVDTSLSPYTDLEWVSRPDRFLVWVDFRLIQHSTIFAIGIAKDKAVDSHSIVSVYRKEDKRGRVDLELERVTKNFDSVEACWECYLKWKSQFEVQDLKLYWVNLQLVAQIQVMAQNPQEALSNAQNMQNSFSLTYLDHLNQRIPATVEVMNSCKLELDKKAT